MDKSLLRSQAVQSSMSSISIKLWLANCQLGMVPRRYLFFIPLQPLELSASIQNPTFINFDSCNHSKVILSAWETLRKATRLLFSLWETLNTIMFSCTEQCHRYSLLQYYLCNLIVSCVYSHGGCCFRHLHYQTPAFRLPPSVTFHHHIFLLFDSIP